MNQQQTAACNFASGSILRLAKYQSDKRQGFMRKTAKNLLKAPNKDDLEFAIEWLEYEKAFTEDVEILDRCIDRLLTI